MDGDARGPGREGAEGTAHAAAPPAAPPAALPGPVLWLTGQFPRPTDAYFLREVAGLRAAGIDLRTASIRRTRSATHVGAELRAEAASTLHVLEAAGRPASLLAHLGAIRRAPGTWARTLLAAWRTAPRGVRGRLYNLIYFHEAAVLAREARAMGAVHLHVHIAKACATVARLAAPLAGIPWSFTLHGPDDLEAPAHWRLDDKVAEAAFVACISSFARSQAMLHSDEGHWGKLHVVHCGVEPERYAALPPPPRPDAFLFVGRLEPVKGVGLLLEAVARARAARPTLTLTVVGDGPGRAALEARAAPLGEAVRFTGFLSQAEVAAMLGSHAALVLPSFAEGVPVSLMEAMAAGRPVIAPRVGGVAELVEHGVSGLVLPPGEEEAVAAAMLEIAADPGRAARMGEAGRARVAAAFDSRVEAARLAALMAWAVRGGPPPARRPEPLGP